MPAVSQKQRSFLFAKFGPEWAKEHHFDNPGKLPQYVKAQAGRTNVGLALFKTMQGGKQKGSRTRR